MANKKNISGLSDVSPQKPLLTGQKFPFLVKLLLAWYGYVYATAWILSIFSIFNQTYLRLSQGLFLGLICFLIFWTKRIPLSGRPQHSLKWQLSDVTPRLAFNDLKQIGFFRPIFIGVVFGLSFVQGFLSAPNTTDAMNYHLPRALGWLQFGSVAQMSVFTSHDFMPPLADYALATLYAVAGSDRFLFLSQWLAGVGVILLVQRLAWLYGFGQRKAWQLMVMVAALPIFVLQLSSTQVDMVMSFLFLAFVVCFLEWWRNEKLGWLLASASALGLAVAAKSVVILFLPVVVVSVLTDQKHMTRRVTQHAWKLLLAAMLMIGVELPWLYQNYQLYGSIVGQFESETGVVLQVTNDVISLPITASNLVRNSFTQLPALFLAEQLTKMVAGVHRLLGVSMQDPNSTWYGTVFSVPTLVLPQEDAVVNPLHFLIFLVGLGVVFAQGLGRLYKQVVSPVNKASSAKNHRSLVENAHASFSQRSIRYGLYGLFLSLILFSALLKWQPWHSRLLLPWFVLATVFSYFLLSHHLKRVWLVGELLSMVLAFALIMLNVSHPLVSYQHFSGVPLVRQWGVDPLPKSIFVEDRSAYYFYGRPYWHDVYQDAVFKIVADIRYGNRVTKSDKLYTVCLQLADGYVYPFWALLNQYAKEVSVSLRCDEGDWVFVTTEDGQNSLTNSYEL